MAGHPAVCTIEGCDIAFTTTALLAKHTASKHPGSFAWRNGETKEERTTRVRRERRIRLREADIAA